jgi:hypothetical protein
MIGGERDTAHDWLGIETNERRFAMPTPPRPVFDHSGDTTVTIKADTAKEFADQVNATIGTPHVEASLEPDIQVSFKTGANGNEVPRSRKITSIGLKVSTAIITARLGLSRANAKHRQAINQMVAIIREHEQKHRAIIENEAIRALGFAQRFVGTGNTNEAEKALTKDLECAMNRKHEALDKV